MRHETSGAALLQAARETLIGEVLPGLGGPQRYAALMVANALKMVERELVVNSRLRAADLAVQAFAGPVDNSAESVTALCRAIRLGRHDRDLPLYEALYARAIEAVAITRPEALTSAEAGRGS